jgi:hypothetical protein
MFRDNVGKLHLVANSGTDDEFAIALNGYF